MRSPSGIYARWRRRSTTFSESVVRVTASHGCRIHWGRPSEREEDEKQNSHIALRGLQEAPGDALSDR